MRKSRLSKKAFTFIEVMILLGIVVVIGGVVVFSYGSFLAKRALTDESSILASTLRNAQARAISGENNNSWGVHFVNNTVNPDYYQVFFGTSLALGTTISITYLSGRLQFTDPTPGLSKDIIFTQTTGIPKVSSSVILQLIGNAETSKQIQVNAAGLIVAI